MGKISWGIIGCGDVTEVKSGPAFNKVPFSSLTAVMRRDANKAADYANRHNVPKWYSNADELINDIEVNAIYIATPPDTHELYALKAIAAGKPVYVEKPMAISYASAKKMALAAEAANVKLCVAHYRREQPLFKKIKQLLDEKIIGDVRLVQLTFHKTPYTKEQLQNNHFAWRVNPRIAGGGLFYDLAPHQLDILYYFFGPVKLVKGIAVNQAGLYNADDSVSGTMLFENGIVFNGSWCFTTPNSVDVCEIIGSKGSLSFTMFNYEPIKLTIKSVESFYSFDSLQHVQQPMIAAVTGYFLGKNDNPCSGEDGAAVMQLMEGFK